MALYVYGLMRTADGAHACAEASRGERARDLELVDHEGLAALVSPAPAGGTGLAREALLAHSETLQEAFAHGPLLPVRFGMVLADRETLERDLLAPHAGAFLSRLDELDGNAEMQVKARYQEEPLLRDVLRRDLRMRRLAQRCQQLPPDATHFDRIALGEAIAGAVQQRRERDGSALVDALRPLAVALSVKEPGHEHEILNASFLVAEAEVEEFDAAVETLSRQHADAMHFRLTGPMPAYSFAGGESAAAAAGTGAGTAAARTAPATAAAGAGRDSWD